MASKNAFTQDLVVNVVGKGFENLQGLGKSLQQIQRSVRVTDQSFTEAIAKIREFARQNVKTTDSIRGQIGAFTKLRGQVGVTSQNYVNLTSTVRNLRRELDQLNTVEERRSRKKQLQTMGLSDKQIRKMMMSDETLGAVQTSQQGFRYARGYQAQQGVWREALANTQLDTEDYASTFRKLSTRQREWNENHARRSAQLENELAMDRRRRFGVARPIGRLGTYRVGLGTGLYGAQNPGESPGGDLTPPFRENLPGMGGITSALVDPRTGGTVPLTSRERAQRQSRFGPLDWRGGRRGILEKLGRFAAGSRGWQSDWRMPGSLRRRLDEMRTPAEPWSPEGVWGANLRDDAGLLDAKGKFFVPRNVPRNQRHEDVYLRSRRNRLGKQVMAPGLRYDMMMGRANYPEDAPRWASDIRTGRIHVAGGRLGGRIGGPQLEENLGVKIRGAFPRTDAGQEARLASLSNELRNLTRGSREYQDVAEEIVRVQNAEAKAFRKSQGVVGDLARKEEQRLRIREKLAKRQAEYVGGGSGTRDPNTGAMIAKGADGLFGMPFAGTRDPNTGAMIAGGTGSFRMPVVKPIREISALYEQIGGLGMTKVNRDIDLMGKHWTTVSRDIRQAAKASDGSINSMNKQKSALEQLRASLNPASKGFRHLTREIDKLDRSLQRAQTRRFSGGSLAKGAGAILSAGYFGGPGGVLGAGIGAGINALRPGGDLVQGAIGGGLIGSQVISPISQFAASSATYAADIEKARIALRKATEDDKDAVLSQQNYQIALRTTAEVVRELNVPQEVAAKGMTRLAAAVQGAGGNAETAALVFKNTVSAIKGTGGSAEDVKSAITAMVQIFSKGRVSAEELSGQLGERFPAAVTLFAEANKLTTEQLQKGLKEGKIGLDKLMNFVIALGDEYGDVAKKIAASSVEAGARATVAWNEVRIKVGDALRPIGAEFQVLRAETIENLIPAFELGAKGVVLFGKAIVGILSFAKEIRGTLATLTVALIGIAAKAFIATTAFKVLAGSILSASASAIKFTAAALAIPWVRVAAIILGAAASIEYFARARERLQKDIELGIVGKDDLEGRIEKLKELEALWKADRDAMGGDMSKFRGNRPEIMAEGGIEKIRKDIQFLTEELEKLDKKEAEAAEKSKANLTKWNQEVQASINKAKDALETYKVEVNNITGAIKNAIVSGFKGMEDALVSFVTTGKLKFREFALSVIQDITRIFIRSAILAPIFNMLSGGKSGGVGGLLGGLFSGGKKSSGGPVGTADPTGGWGAGGSNFSGGSFSGGISGGWDSGAVDWFGGSSSSFDPSAGFGVAPLPSPATMNFGQSLWGGAKNFLGAMLPGGTSRAAAGEMTELYRHQPLGPDAPLGASYMRDGRYYDILNQPMFSADEINKGKTGGFYSQGGRPDYSQYGIFLRQNMGAAGEGGDPIKFLQQQIDLYKEHPFFEFPGLIGFAKGGVIDRPTVSLMGEAGSEAVLPLRRGKDGKLGVAAGGGGNGSTVINVEVEAKGTKVAGEGNQAARLGKMIGAAIQAELVKQKRPGGMLSAA